MIRTANIEVSLQRLSILRIEHPQANPLRLACTLRAGETLPSGLTITAEIHTSRNVAAETTPLASSTVTVAADATSFEVLFDSPQTNQTVTPDGTRALWLVVYGGGDANQLYTLAAADLLLGWHAISQVTAAPPNVTLFVEKGGVAWVTGREYAAGTMVTVGTTAYVARNAHTSGSSTQPGTGGSWASAWAVLSGGGGATNLTATASPTGVVVASDTGTDATIPAATSINAGLLLPAEKTKLANSKKRIFLFGLAGQSNAVGAGGNAALAPTPPAKALQWTSAGGLAQLALTPPEFNYTGETFGTSCVPQWAVTFCAMTGEMACFVVGSMYGGAGMVAGNSDPGVDNFSPTGGLRAPCVSRYLAAEAALVAAGYEVVRGGYAFLQGEADSKAIRDAISTEAAYKAGLEGFIAYLRTNLGASLPFYHVRTGTRNSDEVAGTMTGLIAVRGAQEAVAAADPLTIIVCRETIDFNVRGLIPDGIHYTQVGQNIVGMRLGLASSGIDASEEWVDYFERLTTSASSVGLTSATTASVASIQLPAGDWYVQGHVTFVPNAATVADLRVGTAGAVSLPASDADHGHRDPQWTLQSGKLETVQIPMRRVRATTSVTMFAVARATFSAGSVSAYGKLTATRIR